MRLPSGQGSRGGRRRRGDDPQAAHGTGGQDRTRLVGGRDQPEYRADRGPRAYEERGDPRRPPRSGLVNGGYGGHRNGGPGYGGPDNTGQGYAAQGYAAQGYGGEGYGGGNRGPGYGGGGDGGPGYSNGGPGYGAPGYRGPGYGSGGQGYGDSGYGDGGPGYSNGGPGYGAPGYGAPGYGGYGEDDLGFRGDGNGLGYGGQGYGGDGGYGDGGRRVGRDGTGGDGGSPYGFVEHGPDRRRHRPVRQRRYRRGRGAVRRFPAVHAPVFAAVAFVVCAALVVGGVEVSHLNRTNRAAAAVAANSNCTLIVPENPTSPLGLATPYQLTATNPADGPCNEANATQTAFVQGAVINTQTGQISIYDPLVIDEGTTPAVAPVVPKLPMNSVVALWFGYNGDHLTLAGADQMLPVSPSQPMSATSASGLPTTAGYEFPAASAASDFLLQQANCVSGEDINGKFSTFTQVAACNAAAFFTAADAAITAGTLSVPSPGTAVDGESCLTTRSFALVDQDQSDNVTTEYLAEPNGQIAQDTAANRQSLPRASVLFNGSDNGLLDLFVDPALHCSPWELPNQADKGALTSALPLDELQAATWAGEQGSGPAALVPLNDPMTVDNSGKFNTDKTDAYRSLVNMVPLPAGQTPNGYCTDLEQIQGSRLQQDVNLLSKGPSPAPDAADNLFTFMAMRLQQSFVNLKCASFGQANDVSTTMNKAGVVIAACFVNPVAPLTAGPGNPMADKRTCPATAG
jgi:hypothetical protein